MSARWRGFRFILTVILDAVRGQIRTLASLANQNLDQLLRYLREPTRRRKLQMEEGRNLLN